MCYYMLIIFLILFILILQYLYPKYQIENFTELNLMKTYSMDDKYVDKYKGIISGHQCFYIITDTTIIKYSTLGLGTLKIYNSVDSRIKSLNGGIYKDDKLYITNSGNFNTIEVFDSNLNWLHYIKATGDKGKLVFIDYYNDMWLGCFSHTNGYNTLIHFYYTEPDLEKETEKNNEDNLGGDYEIKVYHNKIPEWSVRSKWYFPSKIDKMPILGGTFINNRLFIFTEKYKIYLLIFYTSSNVMTIDNTINTDIDTPGISYDKEAKLLYGYNKKYKTVVVYKI